jgi:hypothetical protein
MTEHTVRHNSVVLYFFFNFVGTKEQPKVKSGDIKFFFSGWAIKIETNNMLNNMLNGEKKRKRKL